MKTLRSIGAVLAGVVTIVVLSIATDMLMHATGVFPPWGQPMADALFALAFAYRLVFSVAGGWFTARLAPDRPMLHAMLYGLIGLVVCVAGAVLTWDQGPEFGPKWYPIALIAIALPSAWLGGRLHHVRNIK